MTKKERITHEKNTDVGLDNQYELLAKLVKVHGGELSGNITSDYPLANLGLAEKVFIKETLENAGLLRFIIAKFGENSFNYKWDSENHTWYMTDENNYKRFPISEGEKDLIKAYSDYIFKTLMISPDIIAILNRNTDSNFMLKLLGNIKLIDEEGREVNSEKSEELIDRIKGKLAENG